MRKIGVSFTMSLVGLLVPCAQARGSISGPYFNHDDELVYQDSYRGFQRPGADFGKLILDQIESAGASIDLAVQEIRLPRVAQALVRKQRAGVRVRLVIENEYNNTVSELAAKLKDVRPDVVPNESGDDHGTSRIKDYVAFVDMNHDGVLSDYEISQRDGIAILRDGEVPVIDDTANGSKGSALMHHKFMVIDGKRLLVTSANFTLSDTDGDYTSQTSRGNANALMIFDDPVLLKEYQNEFNILWGSTGGTIVHDVVPRFGVKKPYRGAMRTDSVPESGVTVQFSPTPRSLGFDASTSGLINRTLQRAHQSVDMALFVFSEQKFADTLQKATQRYPLDIKVLVEPTFAFQWYSELLDMFGLELLGPRCQAEADNNPWTTPIATGGVPRLDQGDFLHHKFGVVDDKTVIFGSQNWSNAANDSNDENLLVIEDKDVAGKFTAEFERLYREARLGPSKKVLKQIQDQNSRCSTGS